MNKKYLLLLSFLFGVPGLTCYQTASAEITDMETIQQKEGMVKGVIKDGNGEPLIGAAVQLKGSSTGTVTNFDGNFELKAPVGGVLVISYVGFANKEVTVTSLSKPLNIIMSEDTELLDEVVVVGYGVQKKASVVGAISTVGSKDLVKASSPTLSNALTGRLPGLVTVQTSAIPGLDETKIMIRGKGTWVDSNPLYVVDGVERASFTDIDPNEIETISILKDASATAVYGVRGANGVILVTTKRGDISKPKVSFSATVTGSTPTRLPKFINSYETAKLKNEALINDGAAPEFDQSDLDHFLNHDSPYTHPDINWYDEMLNDLTFNQQYNVNVQGGTQNVKYFTSVGYLEQGGIFKTAGDREDTNFGSSRLNFRSNVDVSVTSDLTLSVNLAARIQTRKGPGSPPDDLQGQMNNAFSLITSYLPYETPLFYADGMPAYGNRGGNPWVNLNRTGHMKYQDKYLESLLALNYKLDKVLKGLSAKVQVSYDSRYGLKKQWKESCSMKRLKPGATGDKPEDYVVKNTDEPLTYDAGNSSTNSNHKLYFDASLFYQHTFAEKHNTSALLLYNQSNYDPGYGIPYRYQGLVGRVTYNYDSRYFAEFNMGYNGSENFAKGKRFGFFPSFSLGWMISEERFVKERAPWLEMLKLRVSYGEVGNDKIGGQRFLYNSDYVKGPDYWKQSYPNLGVNSNMVWPSVSEGSLPNLDVTWEKAKKTNIGIDFSMMKGLISLNADIFYEKRNGILMNRRKISALLGINPPAGNVGETENKGFELEVGHRNRLNKNFDYWVKGNFAIAKNKILNYDEPSKVLSWQKIAGRSIDQFTGLLVDGFFQTEQEIADANLIYDFGTPKPGDYRYVDINKDGRINQYDQVAVGHTQTPEITYGFSYGFSYKGFDFSMLWQGAERVSITLAGSLMREFMAGGRVQEHHFDRWAYYTDPLSGEQIDTRATAKYPRLTASGASPSWQQSSASVLDGSYLKLRNIEFGYTVPNSWIYKLHISNLRLFLSANNVLTISDVKVVDPEGPGYGSNREQGYNYPQLTSYNLGVNVIF